MKKIFSAILIVIVAFMLVGCSGETENQNSQKEPVIINIPDETESADNKEIFSSQTVIDTPSISTEQSVVVDNQSISYCGNKNSKKFHKSTCGALKNTKDENKVYFKDRNDYINQGYIPCKRCNP